MSLPIHTLLPELKRLLTARMAVVLQAPPGAGKTTMVPLALLDEPWLAGQRIIMLEPRRLAARAAAQRMAVLLGEAVGKTVGYRVRMDTRVSAQTRIEVVTEGVLTRLLQADPSLGGTGIVIFDEFHERNLQSDLGLALCLESQSVLRPDLRLLVMSATLDGEAVAGLLGGAPVLTSEGKSYPVETHYLAHTPSGFIDAQVAAAVRRALGETEGGILVFLPGAGEIRRVERRLAEGGVEREVLVAPLHGSMPLEAQDRAVAPAPPEMRKVVLATSIAETSLTIEDVRVVIDSGVMRAPRFSPQTGMTRLETVPVSKASADQRRGRAGRVAPGTCYRLWTRFAHQHLAAFSKPEIVQADLAPLALELALWGVKDPGTLPWLDPPPAAPFEQARALLRDLGALDAAGAVTRHGRQMADLTLHPRLAHMILEAGAMKRRATACDLAALLNERDILKGAGGLPVADLRIRLQVLQDLRTGASGGRLPGGATLDRGAARRVLETSEKWIKQLRVGRGEHEIEAAGVLLALAYPDRIAQQRSGRPGHFRLRNGAGARFAAPELLEGAAYLVAANLDGKRQESLIFGAAPLTVGEIDQHFGEQITVETAVEWDAAARSVRAVRRERLDALILKEAQLADPDPTSVAEALLKGVEQEGLRVFAWPKEAERLRERMGFMHRQDAAWPDVSDEALLGALSDWLLPHIYGIRRIDDLQKMDMQGLLLGMLPWDQRQELDERAPSHILVPSGSHIAVDYSNPDAPVLPVRLQEVFGLAETPRIDRGRAPLTLHLLSPAQRPVQVTQDLASFWANTYFEVKKDLKGRYPKHYWPDDPATATPTRRTRPSP